MLLRPTITCVIPARLHSSRLAYKILKPINNKPLIQHVWEQASNIDCFDEIIIAIDHTTTQDIVSQFTNNYLFTQTSCQSGTERIAELVKNNKITNDIIINWQADEPFIDQTIINTLLQNWINASSSSLVRTLKTPLEDTEALYNPNNVKVVCNASNKALYFSRSAIPYNQTNTNITYYKHIGLYAYKKSFFINYDSKKIPNTSLSRIESLEQLAWLEQGIEIDVQISPYTTIGIDTEADFIQACQLLSYNKL